MDCTDLKMVGVPSWAAVSSGLCSDSVYKSDVGIRDANSVTKIFPTTKDTRGYAAIREASMMNE